MKVHVYGNTLNSAYHLTKVLREKGVDAEFFLDQSSALEQDYPWWDDPLINETNLPSWIHYYKTVPFFLLPSKETNKMIQDFSKCDIALVSCYGPMLAMKAKIPFVFYSLGSDLNMISLKNDFNAVLHNSQNFMGKFRKLIKILTYSPLQQRALKKYAQRIIIYMGYQYNPFIVSFNLQHKTHKLCYPKDVINYSVPVDEELKKKYEKFKVVFFMFSRHTWASEWNEYKGNDKFLRAFAKFIKEKNPNVLLITSTKGIDVEKSKNLINEENIASYVEWIDDLPKHLFKKYQSLPNVIMVDNFWHDRWFIQFTEDRDSPKVGFGFGGIETMASSRPLLTAFKDYDFYKGEIPPILEAFTEDEIYTQINKAYEMTMDELQELGKKGFEFALKWHEQTNVVDTHIDILKSVLNEMKNHSGIKN